MLGATALFLPAPGRPACTLRARLNPKAVHSLQKQDTLGQEQTSLLLCRPLSGSPVAAPLLAAAQPLVALAAPASGSELNIDVVWPTNLHLNVVARGRAPGVDYLYLPSWGSLGSRQVQRQFCHGRECAVVRHTTDWISDVLAILR